MAKQAQRDAAASGGIPDKLYFRIGEVAALCGVETYVLRFWQTEFPQLAPKKSGTGQRLYRQRDVEMAMRIKRLLHEEGYTIAGARQVFAAESRELRQDAKTLELPLAVQGESDEARLAREQLERTAGRAQARLARMRQELRELHGILSQPPGSVGAELGGAAVTGAKLVRASGPKTARRAESSLFDEEPLG
jgi:DNA-binding transcriptional MerR regulator